MSMKNHHFFQNLGIVLLIFLTFPYVGHRYSDIALASVVSKPSQYNTNLKSGLVGWWTMDGADVVNGVALDKSGNNNNGNLINIATTTFYKPGKIGQAFNFDGVDDYVSIVSNPVSSFSNPISVCAWVLNNNPTINGTGDFDQTILKLYGDASNSLRFFDSVTSRKLVFAYKSGGVNTSIISSSAVFIQNQWTHVCYTYNGTNKILYANGATVSSIAGPTYYSYGVGNYIGTMTSTGGNWGGKVDDVRIYNRALSATEVRQLYNMGAATKQAVSPNVGPTACTTGLSCGLVGYWTFDGKDTANGVALDKSGNGRNGNLISIATSTFYTKGVIGQAFNFDGTNDRVTTASDSVGTGVATVSAWVKPRSLGGAVSGRIIDNTKAMFTATSSNRVAFTSDGGTTVAFSASNAMPFNTWKFVTVTRDAVGVANIYVNGVLSGTTNQSSGSPAAGAGLQIGDSSAGTATFDGLIDDVRIYNRALSATEIRQLYNMGAATKQAVSPKIGPTACTTGLSCGLVGYWTFDGKDTNWATNKTNDLSGNGNTGTMVSMSTSTSPVKGKVGQGLKFDGVDDYVNIGTGVPMASSTDLTISAWVYPRSWGGGSTPNVGRIIVNSTAGFRIDITGVRLDYTDNGFNNQIVSDTNSISLNKWTHVVLTRNSAHLGNFYVNSQLSGTANQSVTANSTNPATTYIGNSIAKLSPFNGIIDDVRVYNRILSATEIKQLYNMGR